MDIKYLEKSKFYLVYDPNLLLIEHMPKFFLKIRESKAIFSNLDSTRQSFFTRENIFKLKNLKNLDGGKSDAFLFTTFDTKFVIKVLTKKDTKTFLKILPEYIERVLSGSKLVTVFGLFTLKPENIDFIFMENLIPGRENSVIFDLKGSLLNRRVEISSFLIPNKVLKDVNFIESEIKIKPENKDIFNQLINDFEFLCKHNIIDYSLILGIPQEYIYTKEEALIRGPINIGIIDIFQEYNLKKVFEKKFKSIFYDPREISSADPKTYQERITNFIHEYVFYLK